MQPLSKAKLRLFRSLSLKKQRYKHLLCIVEGIKLVQEAYHADWEVIAVIIREDTLDKFESIFNLFDSQIHYVANQNDFYQISTLENPEGICAVVRIPEHSSMLQSSVPWSGLEGPGFILDRIQDPGNMGTILRISHWFGWESIICLGGSVDVLNPKVVRSSMGAIFHVNVYYCKSEQELFQALPGQVWAADLDGISLREISFGKYDFVVLGNEANGLSEDVTASPVLKKIHIPGMQKAESLNVSVAAGIIAYEIFMQNN